MAAKPVMPRANGTVSSAWCSGQNPNRLASAALSTPVGWCGYRETCWDLKLGVDGLRSLWS